MSFNASLKTRSAGILVHPSSLPGGSYCGTFGKGLIEWIGKLSKNNINLWQFLPLTPTDPMGSPYSSPSSFAINPWFLDVNELIKDNFIEQNINFEEIRIEAERLDHFDFKIADKLSITLSDLLLESFDKQSETIKNDFYSWLRTHNWVEDFSIFMVLKGQFNNSPWWLWPEEYRLKEYSAIKVFKKQNCNEILKKQLVQWHLDRQWEKIKRFAKSKNIKLLGDLPFYVSKDSVDVWSDKSLFSISSSGELFFQSGVPPDYFSTTGQLWGTPVYSWPKHESTKFDWWKKRFARQFELVDLLRVDHFRAFSGYWRVDGKEKTAKNGEWVNSPGRQLLTSLKNYLGVSKLPIVAEDLGVITDDVNELRNEFDLPGMKILQFAFDGKEDNPYLPSNIEGNNWVVYTGTHDNATTISWWQDLEIELKKDLEKKYNFSNNTSWNLIEMGMKTKANLFIAPIQDILALDDSSRLNKPGTTKNNWRWKLNKSLNEINDNLRQYGDLAQLNLRNN